MSPLRTSRVRRRVATRLEGFEQRQAERLARRERKAELLRAHVAEANRGALPAFAPSPERRSAIVAWIGGAR